MPQIVANIPLASPWTASAQDGLMGIYRSLASDHREIMSLLRGAEHDADSDRRHHLLRIIRHTLASHARAEEHTLYRTLAGFDATRHLVTRAQSEHDEIERQLRNIFLFELGSESATAAITELRATVQLHVEAVEAELFPRSAEVLYGLEAERLDAVFKKEKERELQRLALEVIL